jgi:hypothetical protein
MRQGIAGTLANYNRRGQRDRAKISSVPNAKMFGAVRPPVAL